MLPIIFPIICQFHDKVEHAMQWLCMLDAGQTSPLGLYTHS